MLCQTCSAFNEDDREFCSRCQNKLLVLSGVSAFEEDEVDDYDEQDDLSLDEHLLERESVGVLDAPEAPHLDRGDEGRKRGLHVSRPSGATWNRTDRRADPSPRGSA